MTDLYDVYMSVQDLYDRFDLTLTPDIAARMLAEETRECLQAADRLTMMREMLENFRVMGSPDKQADFFDATNRAFLEEAADMFFTAVGLVVAMGFTCDGLEDAIEHIVDRNDAKTLDTHEVRAGKITRRPTS